MTLRPTEVPIGKCRTSLAAFVGTLLGWKHFRTVALVAKEETQDHRHWALALYVAAIPVRRSTVEYSATLQLSHIIVDRQ